MGCVAQFVPGPYLVYARAFEVWSGQNGGEDRCDGDCSLCFSSSHQWGGLAVDFGATSILVLGRIQGRQLGGKLNGGPAVSSGSLSPWPILRRSPQGNFDTDANLHISQTHQSTRG